MHKWTNTNDILRDLCEAQGDVPIDVHDTISAEEKPPPIHIKEETEEEYFACSEGPPDGAGPDLKLIQQMLNMVRHNSIGSDSEETETQPEPVSPTPNIIQISKPKTKKKRNNVAINSILLKQNDGGDTIELIKSDELTNTKTETKTETKDLLKEAATNKVFKTKKPAVALEPPTNMFRKKCKVKSPSPATSLSSSSCVSPSSSKESPSCSKVFVPSSSAADYVKKLQEKAKLKEAKVEDIWTKAMKQMKAIEEKRKKEAELAASKNNRNGNDGDTSSEEEEEEDYDRSEPFDPMKMLKLPRHRHFLTKNCVICSVFQQRNIQIYSRQDNDN